MSRRKQARPIRVQDSEIGSETITVNATKIVADGTIEATPAIISSSSKTQTTETTDDEPNFISDNDIENEFVIDNITEIKEFSLVTDQKNNDENFIDGTHISNTFAAITPTNNDDGAEEPIGHNESGKNK